MANSLIIKTLNSIKRNPKFLTTFSSQSQIHTRLFTSIATAQEPQSEDPSSSTFTFSSDGKAHKNDNNSSIYVKAPSSNSQTTSSSSVTMPMSFMTGSIVGKRFYKEVKVRESEDGVGWSVMLDYRTLKTPSKRPLKLPTLPLAKAVAAEWEYQVCDLCVCVCVCVCTFVLIVLHLVFVSMYVLFEWNVFVGLFGFGLAQMGCLQN